ncbi:MAG: protein TolQ [Thermodesulfobacteriota bacterium]|nr:protein TolQ [Thermodesulfobacteriota bacterium]
MKENIILILLTYSFKTVDLAEKGHIGVFDLVKNAGPVVKLVLLILFLFSVISWGIIFFKAILIRRANKNTKNFLYHFWKSQKLSHVFAKTESFKGSPLNEIFREGYEELNKLSKNNLKNPGTSSKDTISVNLNEIENIKRALRRAVANETSNLEKTLVFLATTGNTTPFIGLFGTIWGIMDSFRKIGIVGSTNLAVVAPGISEALIATAAGLAAAIPAVIFYNYFINKVRHLIVEMESFSSEFLNIIELNLKFKQK